MDELSHRDHVCLFALDETGIRIESNNFYGWAPKGLPLYAEANGDHKGVNVIGATEILWVILDNYRPHRSTAPEYESKYQGRLHFMLLPPYSPELNPQENVWAWLKDYCARDSAYTADKELPQRIRKFFVYAYNTPGKVSRRVYAKLYFKTA